MLAINCIILRESILLKAPVHSLNLNEWFVPRKTLWLKWPSA